MRRSLVVACILQFFFALTFAADSNGATQRQNSLRTDRSVTVYKEAPNGIPEFVRGNLSAAAARGNEVSTALGFFAQHREAYRMVDPAGELAVSRIDEDRL
ncbi:MAG: hypothetical protein PVH24_05200, partial [Candidatus Zixiibacteriota bacterium]